MSEELNLTKLARGDMYPRETKKELMKTLLGEEGTFDKERLEVLEDLLKKSNVQFASVSDKIAIDFLKFLSMLGNHELGAFTGELRKRKEAKDPATLKNINVVISSDLLAEISSCPKKEEDDTNTFQALTGFFAFGGLTGVLLTLIGVMFIVWSGITIEMKDLVYILAVFAAILFIPLGLIALQPSLQRIQEKNLELVKRMVNFFNGK